jgi:hypothetical protein
MDMRHRHGLESLDTELQAVTRVLRVAERDLRLEATMDV